MLLLSDEIGRMSSSDELKYRVLSILEADLEQLEQIAFEFEVEFYEVALNTLRAVCLEVAEENMFWEGVCFSKAETIEIAKLKNQLGA